jgi:hypothetical protein
MRILREIGAPAHRTLAEGEQGRLRTALRKGWQGAREAVVSAGTL